jgi:DNA-binding transcriptional LysR family regulator
MDRLSSLRAFQKVVDEGGFAAAARAMDVSPAVVTRLVADLEEHLGTRLLHRTTRRVSLSEAGDAYLERLRVILQELEEADSIVSSQTVELAGTLRLLAPPVLATHLLAPCLTSFRLAYPKIHLDIDVESYRDPPIEDYDVTLIGASDTFDANVIARKVVSTEAILIASPEYLRRHGTPHEPQDLQQHHCLHMKPATGRGRVWQLKHRHDARRTVEVELQPALSANHADTLMRAAIDGAGIAMTPMELAAPLLNSGQLARVLPAWIGGRYALYAAMPSRKFIPRRTQVFLDHFSEETKRQVAIALSAFDGG